MINKIVLSKTKETFLHCDTSEKLLKTSNIFVSERARANLQVPFEREFQTARIRFPMCASPPPTPDAV